MNAETLKGHLDLLLLAAVHSRPAHGYAIADTLRARSDGAFDLPEGTLYPALHRLERAGLLSSRWSEGGRRRRRRVARLDQHQHATRAIRDSSRLVAKQLLPVPLSSRSGAWYHLERWGAMPRSSSGPAPRGATHVGR